MSRPQLFVSAKNESPRMFKNDFLDFFSRVHPAIVPAIFIPLILYFAYQALFSFGITTLSFIGLAFAGLLSWTLFEYLLHRYVFHLKLTSKIGKRFHFIAHGIHHDYPNDYLRLVMPPAVSLGLAVMVYYALLFCFQDKGITAAFFAGFVLGYLIYDMMHFATHHMHFKSKLFKAIQKNHMDHHYVHHESGFGLSSPLWDVIFRTRHSDAKEQ